jgi:hypothetical protein
MSYLNAKEPENPSIPGERVNFKIKFIFRSFFKTFTISIQNENQWIKEIFKMFWISYSGNRIKLLSTQAK